MLSDAILHAHHVLMVLAAGMTCARIRRLDWSKSVDLVRDQLDAIRIHDLRAGPMLGFAWWLLWIPLGVAFGLDFVVEPVTLAISTAIGVIGLIATAVIARRFIRSESPTAQKWSRALAGESLSAASVALEEIAAAKIR